MLDYKKIGENIKKYRTGKMTQSELAFLINRSESSVRKYEKGLIEIPNSVIERIAEVLNVHVSDLRSDMDLLKKDIIQNDHILKAAEKSGNIDSPLWQKYLETKILEKMELNEEHYNLLTQFDKLNPLGRFKAIEQVELLTKIPEYRKDTE